MSVSPPEIILLCCLVSLLFVGGIFIDDFKAAWRGLREWWWL